MQGPRNSLSKQIGAMKGGARHSAVMAEVGGLGDEMEDVGGPCSTISRSVCPTCCSACRPAARKRAGGEERS